MKYYALINVSTLAALHNLGDTNKNKSDVVRPLGCSKTHVLRSFVEDVSILYTICIEYIFVVIVKLRELENKLTD